MILKISVRQNKCQLYWRYFDKPTKSVNDRFIGFFQPDGLDAQSIVNCMTTALNDHNISFEKCIAQAYDGASLMSVILEGSKRKYKKLFLMRYIYIVKRIV